jgi:hypothetical protein
MPIPTTMEMNITEKTLRCPTTSVMRPIDQPRLTASVRTMRSGVTTARNATRSSSRVSAKARIDASRPSSKAAPISSFERAGAPVTPARTPGNSAPRRVTAARMSRMRSRFSMKFPSSRRCATNVNSMVWFFEK